MSSVENNLRLYGKNVAFDICKNSFGRFTSRCCLRDSTLIAEVLSFANEEFPDTKPVSQFEKTLPTALISWYQRFLPDFVFLFGKSSLAHGVDIILSVLLIFKP